MARTLPDAYASGEARRFFGSHYGDPEDRRRAVRAALRPVPHRVAAVLTRQNARFAASPARDANLARLGEGAAAVVTGQQVGLFLGPLYTVYKAASAIRVARALAEESGLPVVPVFWLQTEDHDLPEIAETWIPTAGGPAALRVPSEPGDRISIAHRVLPPEVEACLATIAQELGGGLFAREHLGRLRNHYRAGASWAGAFAGLLAELFADEGLVFLDPRDPALALDVAPVHRRALVEADELSGALLARSREIAAAGFDVAVHVREGSPLSFFHPDGPAGSRYRLAREGDRFVEVGGTRTHSLAELLAALERDPLSFSSSALLRPIVQDTLLPTAAYVGGPGEVTYLAQVGPASAHFGLPVPIVVPRARFRIVDERARKILDRLGLVPADSARPEAELLRRGVEAMDLRAQLLAPFLEKLDAIAPELAGRGLERSITRTRGTVERAVGRFAARYEAAIARADAQRVADVRRLQALLHPNGAPQERVYGLPAFALRHGDRALVERVLAAVDPFDPALKELVP